MACVEPALTSPERLFYLPPFLDPTPFQNERSAFSGNRAWLARTLGLTADVVLVAVGMMRPGDKFESYRQLAEALTKVKTDVSWQLVIVGDGEAAGETKNLFRQQDELSDRTVFAGELDAHEVARTLGGTDICVWPAAGEAYGMALLEAQAAGLPVIAGNLRGVPDVVQDGQTAYLTPPGDTAAFADKTRELLENKTLRQQAGQAASRFVAGQRSLRQAADILDSGLAAALKTHGAKT
jgi:glycosyltransferase involved in cell wall biosynthesis